MKYLFLTLLVLCSCVRQENSTESAIIAVEPGVSEALARHRAALISDVNYKLRLKVPARQDESIDADLTLTFYLSDASEDVQLDFRAARDSIHSLSVNGADAEINHHSEHLLLGKNGLEVGPNEIEIGFTAGDDSLNRNPDYLYTLFVPDRARTAFPVFDQPNLKATYELTLDLPASWAAISNAPIDRLETGDDRRTHHFSRSDLLSTYLFSFVAGEFETVTRNVGGREMTLLHRETDDEKFERNIDAIFTLHAKSLDWLEGYTDIDYPFRKFGFAAIPAFQYGGMEHVGAIAYRADALFLEKDPSETQLLSRAHLIAHETAHMWFGNLVTMDWFNDVWTKEVFANFMAAKIVNPSFPDIDHELSFLLRTYPAAYSVDRTKGANPIRQRLPNLNEAGTLYGAIIYNKAPIMMRQLEALLGEARFQEGIRTYLSTFSNANATWPDLIRILDEKTPNDLNAWSEVWVNTAGRPSFRFDEGEASNEYVLRQYDPLGEERFWPQQFGIAHGDEFSLTQTAKFLAPDYPIPAALGDVDTLLVNSDGGGYGLFPAQPDVLKAKWESLDALQKGALIVNSYEQMLEGSEQARPAEYLELLVWAIGREENELLLDTMLRQIASVYWSFLTIGQRDAFAGDLEELLWREAASSDRAASTRKVFLETFQNIVITAAGIRRLRDVWSGAIEVAGVELSNKELTDVAAILAIKVPHEADEIIETQQARIENPDDRRRFAYLAAALSPDEAARDAFFASLSDEKMRETERWVLDALGYLHHPLRLDSSKKYILPSLRLLEEIQRTGDIFFPARWTAATLGSHRSAEAAAVVRRFLDDRPGYNKQLRLKILQAADPLFRSEAILAAN